MVVTGGALVATSALVKLAVAIQDLVPLSLAAALAHSSTIKAKEGQKGVIPEREQSCSVQLSSDPKRSKKIINSKFGCWCTV